jgi:hypothetical protein
MLDHPICHRVQPRQRRIIGGHVVDLAPRDGERLGHDIFDGIRADPPGAVIAHGLFPCPENAVEALVSLIHWGPPSVSPLLFPLDGGGDSILPDVGPPAVLVSAPRTVTRRHELVVVPPVPGGPVSGRRVPWA